MLCKLSLEASPLHVTSVLGFSMCYVGFGPVFFCTYEECKPFINLSGSPQGHPLFHVLVTPYGVPKHQI